LPEHELESRYPGQWFFVWRDITCATNERTSIAALVPKRPCGNTLSVVLNLTASNAALLCACANSFVYDYCARQKVSGTHLNHFIWRQLPVPSPDTYYGSGVWALNDESLADWMLSRIKELIYTAWDLEHFARDLGYDDPPFRWDAERRFLLRCGLDAAFFHLYGISRDDTDYIMDTFPIVRKNDEKAYGEYRTKRVILEIYDAMAEAVRSGESYQTRLDPPPADPRVAHPPRDAKVVPLAAAAPVPMALAKSDTRRELPAWTPDLLPAIAARTGLSFAGGRWATSFSRYDLGLRALAAVLRNLPTPSSQEDVESAVVLTALPSLLRSRFDQKMRATWLQAIGPANMALTSIAALEIPWAEVLRRARIERILDVSPDGQWTAGPDVQDAPSPELDARALVSLTWLANLGAEDQQLIAEVGALRVA
jgi:hypothetical protein